MEIRLITAPETHGLRREVLRKGDPRAVVQWPGDDHPEGFHLGAFINGNCVGIASFRPEENATLHAGNPFRLRGMATRAAHQGTGIGTKLLQRAVTELRPQEADLLWCNARETAQRFYERLGFAVLGEPFLIEGIGTHYLMYLQF